LTLNNVNVIRLMEKVSSLSFIEGIYMNGYIGNEKKNLI